MSEPEDTPKQHTFSASQVETYLLCRRKWAFAKIAKLRYPAKPSAALGSAVHEELERYLAGEPLDFSRDDQAGYIAASGVHLLPEPGAPGMNIEKPFDFSSVRTCFRWLGRKDIEIEDTRIFPEDPENPGAELGGVPGVSDHKTTSGIGWAKKPEDLEFDVQANLYGYELLTSKDAPAGDLVWTYYQTKGGRRAKRTHLRVFRPHVERMFGLIEDVAEEMAAYETEFELGHGGQDPVAFVQTMPANPTACTAFGGCEHQHVCVLSLRERMRSIMPGVSLLDSLKKRAQEGAAPEATPVNVNPPAEDVATPPAPPVVAEPTPEPAPEPAAPLVVADAAPESTPVKRGPGRPRKTPATAPETSPEPAPADGNTAKPYTLFVNCYPVPSPGRRMREARGLHSSQLVELARHVISGSPDAENIADYRFAPYGQGPGMLVVAVRHVITSDKFAANEVYVDTRTPEGAILLDVLMAHAHEIVRAA